jgi:hypothetical protein
VNYTSSLKFEATFRHGKSYVIFVTKKTGLADFLQTHLVTLPTNSADGTVSRLTYLEFVSDGYGLRWTAE